MKTNPIYCPKCGSTEWRLIIAEELIVDTVNKNEEGRWSPMPVGIACNNCCPEKSDILTIDDTEYLLENKQIAKLLENPREKIEIEQPHKRLKARLKRKAVDE